MTEWNAPFTGGPTLNDGVTMPWLGLGVWQAKDGDEVISAVKSAVEAGYRSIDTAAGYNNEEGVGQAIRECGVPREELFITTKVRNPDQGYESTLKAFETSRKKLGLEQVDLYLIHWPVAGKYKDTWKALIHLQKEGLVKSIGVSNFQIHHLQDIIEDSGVVPVVDQVEFHPLLTQRELLKYTQEHDIQLEAWSPLMQGISICRCCRSWRSGTARRQRRSSCAGICSRASLRFRNPSIRSGLSRMPDSSTSR